MKRSFCLFAPELTGCEGEVGGGIGRVILTPSCLGLCLPFCGVSERVKLNGQKSLSSTERQGRLDRLP